MTKEKHKYEADKMAYKLKNLMIAEEKDKLKLQKQVSEKQHMEKEAQRKHDKEEGERKRREAERLRQHEKEESEKGRQFAERQQLRELEIERTRTERARHESEKIKRIIELLGKCCNYQQLQVETIKDILSSQPQDEHRVKAKRSANGHQVDCRIENYK